MTDLIGYLAAFLTTIAYIPQVVKVYKTKDTQSLSLGMFGLLTLGIGLWLVYGLLIGDWPLIVANGITFMCAAYIVSVKLRR